MNNPTALPNNYVEVHKQPYMKFAYDEHLNDVKRGIMIDRLTSRGDEPQLTVKLIKLYRKTNNTSVKEKIISGLMIYYHHHLDLNKNSEEQQLLKSFFATLLYEKLSPKAANNTVRGFVDLHEPHEVMGNLPQIQIDMLLATINHTSSIMLKYSLVHKSRELQPIYMHSIINELRIANDADLDSYLFGPLSMAYEAEGKNLLDPEAKQLVLSYLKEVKYKYTSKGIKERTDDFHRSMTAPYYFELIKKIGV
jgi:hypothetical protein